MFTVVVGHGRSPEGRGWGKLIDSADRVVRMWDWSEWQAPADYGMDYTHGVFVLTRKQIEIFWEHNKAWPTVGWLAFLGKPTGGLLPNNTTLIDPTPWTKLAQERFGGAGIRGTLTLTRGTQAACWALDTSGPGDQVVLVGFDNVVRRTNMEVEAAFCPAYWKLYNDRFPNKDEKVYVYPPNQPLTNTHDMRVESPLLHLYAEKRQIKFAFAQNIWR